MLLSFISNNPNPFQKSPFSKSDKKQLIDYGYIQDVEIDSDDEDEDFDDQEDQAGYENRPSPPSDAPPAPAHQEKEEVAPTQEGVEDGEEGKESGDKGDERNEAPSKTLSLNEPTGLGTSVRGVKGGGGAQQPRFAPQRMFMDEVKEAREWLEWDVCCLCVG